MLLILAGSADCKIDLRDVYGTDAINIMQIILICRWLLGCCSGVRLGVILSAVLGIGLGTLAPSKLFLRSVQGPQGCGATMGLFAIVLPFALMWVVMREEMFIAMSDYMLPLLAPVRLYSQPRTAFIPDLTANPLMSIVANFDLAQPLSIVLIGWSMATIYGLFYRVVTK